VADLLNEGEIWTAAGEVIWAYLAGNTVLAVGLALIIYFLGFQAVRAYQKKRQRHRPESLPNPSPR
jgi:uncharacterized protein (DUF2062 family)